MLKTFVTISVLLVAVPAFAMPEGGGGTRNIYPVDQSYARLITGPPPPPREVGTPAGPPDLGEAVDVIPGAVAILLTKPVYREGERIFATIANGLDQTVYGEDHKTDCSFVFLQVWTGSQWFTLHSCMIKIPTSPTKFGSGHGRRIVIDPTSGHLPRRAVGALAFGQGWYRLAFLFTLTPTPRDRSELHVVYSPVFRIDP